MDDLDRLRELETAMWTASTRGDPGWIEAHLSPTFTEFGRSGRSCDRAAIIDLPIDGDIDVALPLSNFAVRFLHRDVALVTYRSVEPSGHSNRASVWVRIDDRWLLDFHQGTPTDA